MNYFGGFTTCLEGVGMICVFVLTLAHPLAFLPSAHVRPRVRRQAWEAAGLRCAGYILDAARPVHARHIRYYQTQLAQEAF
jgi:hypothetical protein